MYCSFFLKLHNTPTVNGDWFEFKPDEDYTASAIDMSGWLDAPAGKHGFLKMQGKDLVFENAQAVKFWGVNISSGRYFFKVSG